MFEDYNHTELYQACLGAGILVQPSESKESLSAYLSGEKEPQDIKETDNEVHKWRHGLMQFVLEHWSQISTQITCPAKSGNPRSCFGCIDTRVIHCVIDNSENENLIESYMLRRENRP